MWTDTLLSLADEIAAVRSVSPGRHDSHAAEKLQREREELDEALAAGDIVGAWTEVADVVYYAAKCVATQKMTEATARRIVSAESASAGVDFDTAVRMGVAKYKVRIRNNEKGLVKTPAGDAREREAVVACHWGYGKELTSV